MNAFSKNVKTRIQFLVVYLIVFFTQTIVTLELGQPSIPSSKYFYRVSDIVVYINTPLFWINMMVFLLLFLNIFKKIRFYKIAVLFIGLNVVSIFLNLFVLTLR